MIINFKNLSYFSFEKSTAIIFLRKENFDISILFFNTTKNILSFEIFKEKKQIATFLYNFPYKDFTFHKINKTCMLCHEGDNLILDLFNIRIIFYPNEFKIFFDRDLLFSLKLNEIKELLGIYL